MILKCSMSLFYSVWSCFEIGHKSFETKRYRGSCRDFWLLRKVIVNWQEVNTFEHTNATRVLAQGIPRCIRVQTDSLKSKFSDTLCKSQETKYSNSRTARRCRKHIYWVSNPLKLTIIKILAARLRQLLNLRNVSTMARVWIVAIRHSTGQKFLHAREIEWRRKSNLDQIISSTR